MYLYLYGSVSILNKLIINIQSYGLKIYPNILTMSDDQHFIIIIMFYDTIMVQNYYGLPFWFHINPISI